ncbi:hypothetical protein GOP47_0022710 [Adiantum capillus-veneris]|uniref:TIR domain-containing protein n=1 Tax=Adiantum capillus-veneris TaxID=13818 RepID=A0A9D4Z741_ADICA|nr:hypothetical protein GOP47_0022710 [Adiantum capillus-veneris]
MDVQKRAEGRHPDDVVITVDVPTTSSSAAHGDDKDLPWIFLNHSGHQKAELVEPLYYALHHTGHRPFFDLDCIDSLPSGHSYPTRIFQACLACKMGVVVLSEDYVQSLWPMLELQYLLRGRPERPIYPLFYKLKPSDLTTPANLERWKKCWAKNAHHWQKSVKRLQEDIISSCSGSRGLQINLDLESWPANLGKLNYRSGDVDAQMLSCSEKSAYRSSREYIDAIVENICAQLPPPSKYSLKKGIKGKERMCEMIHQVFTRKGSKGEDEVIAIGVHGIGGSGKTSLCKMMANFYGNEFPGRSLYLELPTPGDKAIDSDKKMLLRNINDILPAFTSATSTRRGPKVSSIDEAMNALKEGLQRHKAFLAIDNVWDNSLSESDQYPSFEYAQQIIDMKCMPGTKIMVTSRSKQVVSFLLQSRAQSMEVGGSIEGTSRTTSSNNVVHIPSLTEEEAMQALRYYCCDSSFIIPDEDLRKIALNSCFFEEQCHPLCLKLQGAALRQVLRQDPAKFNSQEWVTDPKSNIYSEGAVLKVVEKSLDAVPSSLLNLFIDLATFKSDDFTTWIRYPPWTFVRLHYDDYTEDRMHDEVLRLEYHGLLELVHYDDDEYGMQPRLVIHDLLKRVAKSRVALPNHVDALVNSAIIHYKDFPHRTTDELLTKKHVTLVLEEEALFETFSGLAQVRYLSLVIRYRLSSVSWPWEQRGLQLGINMKALRVLELKHLKEIKEITGWEGTPNLVWLILESLEGLRSLGPYVLGRCQLTRLEKLSLQACPNLEVQSVVGYTGRSTCIVEAGHPLPQLQELSVYDNLHLAEVGPLPDACPALTKLQLRKCPELKHVPNLNTLSRLLTLDLWDCKGLRTVEGSFSSLTALRQLILCGCGNLESIPDLDNLRNVVGIDTCGCSSLTYLTRAEQQLEVMEDQESGFVLPFLGRRNRHNLEDSPFVHLQDLRLELAACKSGNVNRCLDVSGLPLLKGLDLKGLAGVRKLTLSSTLHNLRWLSLTNFSSLEEISGLLSQVPRIEIKECPLLVLVKIVNVDGKNSLNLSECTSLSDVSTVAYNLVLSGCTSFTDVSAVAILTDLETLDLSGCTSLTDVSALATLTNLQTLYLSGCTSLTDVSALATLTNLEALDLSGCTSLTDVWALATLTNLEAFDLSGCTSLTDVSADLATLSNLRSTLDW